MQTFPDTISYLYLALGSVGVLVLGYIGSLWLRQRQLQQDIQTLRELEDE